MDLDNFSSGNLFYAFFIAFFLHYIFARKHIISFLDPWIMMFFNQVMILTVIIYSFLEDQILNVHFYYCIFSWISFIVGLSIFSSKNNTIQYRGKIVLSKFVTTAALKIYLLIFLLNASIIFSLMGIPLFLNGPRTISAYSNMGSGFGVLFYLNWGLQTMIQLLSLKVWLIDKKRSLGMFAIFTIIIFNFLNGGSRAGYLDLIMVFSLGLFYLKKFKKIDIGIPKVFKYALLFLPVFIILSFISAVNVGYESNVFFALIKRTIGAAEGPFYYFIKNSYSGFKGLNLFSYHFSQILPYFGYIDRNAIDVGVNLTNYSDLNFGTPGYGPNPTMFVIGHIALGNFGFIYCFIIGLFLSFLRYRFKSSFFIWMLLNTQAIALTSDGTLMPLTIFFLMFLSPILVVALFISGANSINSNSKFDNSIISNN